MKTTIIGIDCATQNKKVGLARGKWDGTAVSLEAITLGQTNRSIAHTVDKWLPENGRVLLALDAPLGWPQPLGRQLAAHRAGEALAGPANRLFRRQTDTFVWQTTGKLPLDVGADRIARTAYTALGILAELRQLTGAPIPLAWQPPEPARLRAIEVYPAGTLRALLEEKVPFYKGKQGQNGRTAMLQYLSQHMALPTHTDLLLQNDDALDAAVCVLAGADFLQGKCHSPADLPTARKEGWIWVRQRENL